MPKIHRPRRLIGAFASAFAVASLGLAVLTTSGAFAGQTLTFAGWGGAGENALVPAYFTPFASATGINVTPSGPIDYEKIVQMVKAHSVSWDVVQIDPDFGFVNSPYLEKLNCKEIDCKNLTVGGLRTYPDAVPLETFSTVLTYSTTAFPKIPPQTWADFYNFKKYPGKRAIMDNLGGGGNGTIEEALVASGVSPKKLYPLNVTRALNEIEKLRKAGDVVFYQTNQQCEDLISSGEAVMGNCLNGDAAVSKSQGAKLGWSWDQQFLFADYVAIPKGDPNSAAAMKLIAYMTSKQHNAAYASQIAYGPTNSLSLAAAAHSKYAADLPSLHSLKGANAPIVWDGDWWFQHENSLNKKWLAFTSS
jgi:putative spermidine/putrescine transport system substrate-binding protein